jgi:hypothetical protein
MGKLLAVNLRRMVAFGKEISWMKAVSETPNTKHQTPTNFQIPNINSLVALQCCRLVFEGWRLFGVWCLVFGV